MRVRVSVSALTVLVAIASAGAVSGCGGSSGGGSGGSASEGSGGSGGSMMGSDAAGSDLTDAQDAPDIAAISDTKDAADMVSAPDAHDATVDAGVEAGDASDAADVVAARCQEMLAKCMLVDPGTGAIHTCVTTGMQGNAAACEASFASCTQSCGAALCTHLGTLCHDKDEGCHEMGHAGVADPCFVRALECVDLCK